ncbi:MAG: hypothetical protein GYA36_20680 [Veillonellaceae bacterium]|nr:hypothetical protein [Veillonellaceae bacterium]
MITFNQFTASILPVTLKYEGGYSNTPGDKGGETYRGISRRANPGWSGWKFIDKVKKPSLFAKEQPIKQNTIFPELEPEVAKFYYTSYFVKNGFHLLNSTDLALVLFDWAVHGGYSLQRVLGVVKRAFGRTFNATTFDSKLASWLESLNKSALISELISERNGYLKNIVQNNPSQKKFESGWDNRLIDLKSITVGQKVGIGFGLVLLAILIIVFRRLSYGS